MKLRTLLFLLLAAAGLSAATARSKVAAGDTLYVRTQSGDLVLRYVVDSPDTFADDIAKRLPTSTVTSPKELYLIYDRQGDLKQAVGYSHSALGLAKLALPIVSRDFLLLEPRPADGAADTATAFIIQPVVPATPSAETPPPADAASSQTTVSNQSLLQKSVVQTLHGDTLHTRKTWDVFGLTFSLDKDNPQPRRAPKPFYFDVHVPMFYVAFTGMASDALDVRSGNSWELGGYISESRAFTASERFGGSIGFGLSRSYYRLKGRGVLQADEDGHTFLAPIDPEALDYTKPGINYWSWRLPLMLGWQRSASGPHVGLGVEAELRHHVRSRVHSGGDRKHVVAGNSLDVQPWACNVLLMFGCESHSVFARFSLTDFFGPNAEFDAMPFCVGYAF